MILKRVGELVWVFMWGLAPAAFCFGPFVIANGAKAPSQSYDHLLGALLLSIGLMAVLRQVGKQQAIIQDLQAKIEQQSRSNLQPGPSNPLDGSTKNTSISIQ